MKKLLLIIISISFLFNTSCNKYLDVNTDPAYLTEADPENMITAVIVKAAYNTYGDQSIFSSLYTNQTIGIDRQAQATSNYTSQAGDFDNVWKFGFYTSSLKSAYDLKEIAKEKNQPHYQAVGNILLAYGIVQATDLWGDIPYTQAFKGLDVINPTFDKQEIIYKNAETLLNEAIKLLGASNMGIPISNSKDILFGGEVSKWVKFANSLKARNYLHLAKVSSANYSKALSAAALGFTSSEDNPVVNFVDNGSYNGSPWFQFNNYRGDIIVHDDFIAKLTSTNDPRYTYFVDTSYYNVVGSYYGSDNTMLPLMSYDELLFIKAEAEAATAGSASSLAMAISQNLIRITGSDNPTFAASASADGSLANVMLQKHIALFLNPESWTDWRRTNLPALTPNRGTQIPRSYFYSAQEQKVNSNCPPNSTQFRKVWWDK